MEEREEGEESLVDTDPLVVHGFTSEPAGENEEKYTLRIHSRGASITIAHITIEHIYQEPNKLR